MNTCSIGLVMRRRIAAEIDTRWDDLDASTLRPACGLILEKVIACDHRITSSNRRGEAVQPAGMVQSLRSVGITQKYGIIEVEEQSADRTAQTCQLPWR